jgi:hypothetical protein
VHLLRLTGDNLPAVLRRCRSLRLEVEFWQCRGSLTARSPGYNLSVPRLSFRPLFTPGGSWLRQRSLERRLKTANRACRTGGRKRNRTTLPSGTFPRCDARHCAAKILLLHTKQQLNGEDCNVRSTTIIRFAAWSSPRGGRADFDLGVPSPFDCSAKSGRSQQSAIGGRLGHRRSRYPEEVWQAAFVSYRSFALAGGDGSGRGTYKGGAQ